MTLEAPQRRFARVCLGLFYALAGCAHLAWPDPFISIAPGWVPWPAEVVLLTGLAEIAGAAALQAPPSRRFAGLMLAVYALAVWPANITHAMLGIQIGFLPASWWYHGPRLALQPVLIGLALYAGGWLPRKRLDRALKPVEGQRIHPSAHELADQSGRVCVAPAHLRHRIEPD